MSKLKVAGLIPTRLESSRLPGKALADICGLPMILHVYRRALLAKSLDDVYVVTDSSDIANTVTQTGGKVLMTGSHHETGTDRIAEAAKTLDHDIIVNIQGDEALLDPLDVNAAVEGLRSNPSMKVAILVTPYSKRNSPSDMKTVLNENNEVMYFSRNDIPSDSRSKNAPMLKAYHVIPFRRNFLFQYNQWPKGRLEQLEYNEYLRILEKGEKILAVHVESEAISVDTPDDLAHVQRVMPSDPYFGKY